MRTGTLLQISELTADTETVVVSAPWARKKVMMKMMEAEAA